MSLLPNNTYANPANSFYGEAGQGSANSLQSPAEIIPDVNGNISLLGQGTGNGAASLIIATEGGGTGDAAITIAANGVDYSLYVPGTSPPGLTQGNLYIGQNGQPQAIRVIGSTGVSLLLPTTVTDVLSVASGANVSFTTNPITNITTIGNPLTSGAVYLNNTTTVTNSGSRPPVGGIVLQQTAASNANISQQVASGAGSLTLGSSVTNPTSLFINDTGGGADTAVVDITKGTGTGIALRLQGYGTGAAAQVSTNVGVGGGGVLNLTSATNNPVPAISINDTAIRLELPTTVYSAPNAGVGYGGITQQIINSGGNLDQLPWNITNPAAVGFYNILVRVGDNAAVNINGQINTFGYWNGSIWVAGGCGSSQPIGTGNLLIWFGSTATSRAQLILQNTGSASLSQVAVYLVPMLSGSVPIMT